MNTKNGMKPVHPGKVLSEKLNALGLSVGKRVVKCARRSGQPGNDAPDQPPQSEGEL